MSSWTSLELGDARFNPFRTQVAYVMVIEIGCKAVYRLDILEIAHLCLARKLNVEMVEGHGCCLRHFEGFKSRRRTIAPGHKECDQQQKICKKAIYVGTMHISSICRHP